MPKILLAECKQEVSTFNPVISQYDDFDIDSGDDIVRLHRGLPTEMGGAIKIFDEQGNIELVPTYSARAITSGGTLAGAAFERIATEFLDALRAAPPVDGIYFSMHGAMAAETEDDPEGYLLFEARKIVGGAVPIVASFDLHGVLTDRILQHADAIVAYHTYPHTDFLDTGIQAARVLLDIMAGEIKPVTAKVAIPALVRGPQLITATGLFGRILEHARLLEQTVGGVSAGMFIGNPFTDVPALQSYSFAVTDDDAALAEREALQMAREFWSVRHELQADLVSLSEAVEVALATTNGTVIFTDAADATSSGASGDGNAIMRALMDANYRGRVLLPLVDPAAVEAAFAAGVGHVVHVSVGGALDPQRFEPVLLQATVRLLSDGRFVNESHGTVWKAGKTAVLEMDNFTLVVTSRPVSLYDRSLFLAHGQDPQRFDAVIVKSPYCQPHFFDDWGAVSLNVDAPGSTSANLHSLGHTRCPRPIFPLEDNFAYEPQAQIFRRP